MKPLDDVEQDLLQQIQGQYNIREMHLNTKYHIHQKYTCECNICFKQITTDNQIKKDIKLDSFYEQSKINNDHSDSENESFFNQVRIFNNLLDKKKVHETHEAPYPVKDPIDFLGLCLKLMQNERNGKTLNVRVMDTLFFFAREPCLFVYHDKERGLKIWKERHLQLFKAILINMLELRNFFIQRRSQYDFEVRTETEKRLNPSFNTLEFDQKSAETVQKIKKEIQNISITQKDFILVRFRNGGHQIMHQLEMMQLFDKRRIDQIWDQIITIQAYPYDITGLLTRRPDQNSDDRYYRIQYQKERVKFDDLFQKALEQICNLNNPNLNSGNHIREHERYQKGLIKENVERYLTYQVYMIVHFFEAYHKRKLTKIRIDFARDDFGNYYIIDANMMAFVEISKIKWDEMILKEISLINQDFREIVGKEIDQLNHERKEKLAQQIQPSGNQVRIKYLNQACSEITEYIRSTYIQKIEEAEIELQNQGDIEKTNKIFKVLNPNVSLKFSYMLGLHKDEEEILKRDLLNNFPTDKVRFLKQQKQKLEQKTMEEKREVYKRSLKLPAKKQQSNIYSIQTQKSQFLVKTKFIPKQKSGTLLRETKEDHFENYIGRPTTRQSNFSRYKY